MRAVPSAPAPLPEFIPLATAPLESPRDCVVTYPAVGGALNLVGYDAAGEVQVELRLAKGRLAPRWEAIIMAEIRAADAAVATLRPRLLK